MTTGCITGDLHLGLRVEDLDRTPEILTALDLVINTAIERNVDFVELGGDLTDNNHPTSDVIAALIQRLNRLEDAGIETHVLGGNHEAVSAPGRYWALTPLEAVGYRHVHFHKEPTVYMAGSHGQCLVFLPHVTRATAAASSFAYPQEYVDVHARRMLDGLPDDVSALVFCHYNLRAAKKGTEASMLRQSDLELPHWVPEHPRVAAVFAHHVHSPQRFGKVRIVGSPICTDFGDLSENKRFLFVQADGAKVKCTSIRTPQAPLIEFELDFRERTRKERVSLLLDCDRVLQAHPDAIVKARVLIEEDRMGEVPEESIRGALNRCRLIRSVQFVPIRARQVRSTAQRSQLAPVEAVDVFLSEQKPEGAARKRALAAAILAGEPPGVYKEDNFRSAGAARDSLDDLLAQMPSDPATVLDEVGFDV